MRNLLHDIGRILLAALKVSGVITVIFAVWELVFDEMPELLPLLFLLVILTLLIAAIPLVGYAIWRIILLLLGEHDPDLDDYKDLLLHLPLSLLGTICSLFFESIFDGSGSGSSPHSGGHSQGGSSSAGSFGRSGGSRGSGVGRKF